MDGYLHSIIALGVSYYMIAKSGKIADWILIKVQKESNLLDSKDDGLDG